MHRISIHLLSTVVLSFLLAACGSTQPASPIQSSNQAAPGLSVQTFSDGTHHLRNYGTGQCLDGYMGNGDQNPYLAPCDDNNLNQRWQFVNKKYDRGLSYIQIRNLQSGLCLVGYVRNDYRPYYENCDNNNWYHDWSTYPFVSSIKSRGSGLYLNGDNGNGNIYPFLTANNGSEFIDWYN